MNTRRLGSLISNLLIALWLGVASYATLTNPALGQAPAFSLNPMRMDVELGPGTEKTVSFEVKAGASSSAEQGHLVLSVSDWAVLEDGSLAFSKAASEKRSASSWITFSPSALTIQPGRSQLVRITVAVPENTAPGSYWTALFVQERAPATPPEGDVRAIFVRVRFAFLLYVVVSPAHSDPQLVNVEMDTGGGHPKLICEMTNDGNRHVRPLIFWELKRLSKTDAQGKLRNTALQPFATLREPHSLDEVTLTPGSYEILVNVDFQDGKPLQSMTRPFEVPPPEPSVSGTVEYPDSKTGSSRPPE